MTLYVSGVLGWNDDGLVMLTVALRIMDVIC